MLSKTQQSVLRRLIMTFTAGVARSCAVIVVDIVDVVVVVVVLRRRTRRAGSTCWRRATVSRSTTSRIVSVFASTRRSSGSKTKERRSSTLLDSHCCVVGNVQYCSCCLWRHNARGLCTVTFCTAAAAWHAPVCSYNVIVIVRCEGQYCDIVIRFYLQNWLLGC